MRTIVLEFVWYTHILGTLFGGRSPASDHICKVPFGKGVLSAVCVCKERAEPHEF